MDTLQAKITKEINDYRYKEVELFEGYSFSAHKLLRRISLYKTHTYPTGKFDSQGNMKYWFDIITPRVNAEVKNIDFSTKDISLYSDAEGDTVKTWLANARLENWLHESKEDEQLVTAVEQGSEWGNVVWKKTKDGYEIKDLSSVMVLNQTAYDLNYSDVIEEECMLASDLQRKSDVWDKVDELVELGKADKKSSPEYYVYERNGEISEREYNLHKGKKGGKNDKYILAKVIAGGVDRYKPTIVLFCESLNAKDKSDIYKEYHRSSFAGKWLRVGMYELLMDYQTRANEIGNQIARGLEWASKTVFASPDKLVAQNILTDLQNGDIVKTNSLQQVETRMNGLDQLIADWNRIMTEADKLANSFEVVTGEDLPSGTPFQLAAVQNQNANKLFNFIRQKLGLVMEELIEDWMLPRLLKDLKGKEILYLTQDSGYLQKYYTEVVNSWYLENLLSLPPHTDAIALTIKAEKLQELQKNDSTTVNMEEGMWKDFWPRVKVVITGENVNLQKDLASLSSFIQLEQDPVRRTALIEIAMKKTGLDVSSLPKTPPQAPPQAPQGQPEQSNQGSGVMDNILAAQGQAMK